MWWIKQFSFQSVSFLLLFRFMQYVTTLQETLPTNWLTVLLKISEIRQNNCLRHQIKSFIILMYYAEACLKFVGPISASLCPEKTALFSKKCRSGDEPLATLCSIWPARILNLWPIGGGTGRAPAPPLFFQEGPWGGPNLYDFFLK